MKLSRRSFLGGTVALTTALSGCLNNMADTVANNGNRNEQEPLPIADSTEEVEEDYYVFWDFSVEGSGTLEYDFIVREGPDVDVIVLASDEFDHFEANHRFQYLDSSSGASDIGSVTLSSGDYVLMVDNTTTGEVSPPSNLNNDTATVEIEASLQY